MRVLVAGGAGFLGSHLVERLLAEGHEVDVADDLSTGSIANLDVARAEARLTGRLRIHTLDVQGPEAGDLLARRGPEVLVHLGPAGVGSAFVAVAAATASVRKVVSVHPALVPDLAAARDRHHLDFTVLHVAAEVHGPRRRDGVVAALLAGAPVPGPPAREVPLLAVDDVVDALVRAMVRGGGLALDVPGVALPLASVAAALGVLPVWTDDGPAAPAHGGPPVDGRRCRTYLGWRPFSDPAEALAATARWWRER